MLIETADCGFFPVFSPFTELTFRKIILECFINEKKVK
jgi:hypothetical protein